MERVHVSLGSNIDCERNVPAGLRALHARFGPLTVSSVFECPAVGFDGEPFHNLVAAFDSDEAATAIHAALHRIEDGFGRDRSQPKFSSRILDLDLLLCGDRVVRAGRLILPRPEIERVAFVLAPLAELDGSRLHPVHGVSFLEMWTRFGGIGAEELRPVDPAGLVPPEVLA